MSPSFQKKKSTSQPLTKKSKNPQSPKMAPPLARSIVKKNSIEIKIKHRPVNRGWTFITRVTLLSDHFRQ